MNEKLEPLYIGVDGGGTKTKITVVDSNDKIIYSHVTGAGNLVSEEPFVLLERFSKILVEMHNCIPSYINMNVFAVLGLAGVSDVTSEKVTKLHDGLVSMGFANTVEIINDAPLAWYSVANGDKAIALISGTGFVAFTQDNKGKSILKGGLGALFADQGSGYQIGLQGIRTALSSAQHLIPPTTLIEALFECFNITDINQIPVKITTKKQVSQFALQVYECAKEGDETANLLLKKAAADLAKLALAVYQDAGYKQEKVTVGMIGGCFANMDLLREYFKAELFKKNTLITASLPLFTPEMAAVEMAKKLSIN